MGGLRLLLLLCTHEKTHLLRVGERPGGRASKRGHAAVLCAPLPCALSQAGSQNTFKPVASTVWTTTDGAEESRGKDDVKEKKLAGGRTLAAI